MKHFVRIAAVASLAALQGCILPIPIPTEWIVPGMNAVLSEQVVAMTRQVLAAAEVEQNRAELEANIGVVTVGLGEKYSLAVGRHLLQQNTNDIQIDGIVTGMIQHHCTKPDYDVCFQLVDKYAPKISDLATSLQFVVLTAYFDAARPTGRSSKIFEARLRRDWPIRGSDPQTAVVNLQVEAYLIKAADRGQGERMKKSLEAFIAQQHQTMARLKSDESGLLAKAGALLRNAGALLAANSAGIAEMVYVASIAADDADWGAGQLTSILKDMKADQRHLCNLFGFKLIHLQLLAKDQGKFESSPRCFEHLNQIDETTLPLMVAILELLDKRNIDPQSAIVAERVVDYLETRRIGSTSKDARRSILSSHAGTYELVARVQARTGSIERAFNTLDGTKARTLIDYIGEVDALRDLSLKPQDRDDLQRRLQYLISAEQSHALAIADSSSAKSFIDRLQSDRDVARTSYFEHVNQVSSLNPKFKLLSNPRKWAADDQNVGAIQPDEIFINYFISQSEEGAAWLVDATGKPVRFDLGSLKNISATVAAYREIIAPSHDIAQSGRLVALKGGGYEWLFLGQTADSASKVVADDRVTALSVLSSYFHEKLLRPISPIASQYKRWIVSPDKDLALLPFDTLREGSAGSVSLDTKLVQSHVVTLVQSFAVHRLLKKRALDYNATGWAQSLLAMGNAVYGDGWADGRGMQRGTGVRGFERDARSASASEGDASAMGSNALLSAVAEKTALNQLQWRNLPGTAREIKAVAQIFANGATGGGLSSGVDTYVGADASEAKLQQLNQSGKLKDYRYLLFSAHGYLAQNPALSALVLSQRNNPPDVDGYVTAAEWPLYDVRSDLTVLSACDTGVGKTQAGESVMGLPYALFVAGNKNTLLSLWPVDDDATAEFMSRFFAKLKAGQTQPDALSATKREFVAHPQWSQPKFWAAFVLYGV